tara:strand:+ start:22210 stop:22788 length:579 start_codon:yes stop_codon:yes gene_type:complete
MLALVGLGNPGKKHNNNRHNVGFMAIDCIIENYKLGAYKTKFQSKIITKTLNNTPLILLKPQTFMNLSGQSLNHLVKFYKLNIENIIVFHDDLDLQFGVIKAKIGGSNGGHNGLSNIDSNIGTNYKRIRIGIGHPGNKNLVNNHVLSDFTKTENNIIKQLLNLISENIETIIKNKNISETISEIFKTEEKKQ